MPMDFPGGSDDKESTCNAGDLGSIPGWGRSPEKGMATHSSILAWRNSMDKEAWKAAVHMVTESDTTEVTVHQIFKDGIMFIVKCYKSLA